MLRRLIISLAQLQAGNNLENFNCAKKSPKKPLIISSMLLKNGSNLYEH